MKKGRNYWMTKIITGISISMSLFLAGCGVEEKEPVVIGDTAINSYYAEESIKEDEDTRMETEEIAAEESKVQVAEFDHLLAEYIQDVELREKIKETISLKKDTEIENIMWVDTEKQCLRVAIKYIVKPEGLWYQHAEDYFYFLQQNGVKMLWVDYGEDIDMERTVWADPTFEAKLEDINFDGQEDLIISLGQNGVMMGEVCCAYLYTEEGYEYCPSFEEIGNYSIDNNKKCILSNLNISTAEGREERSFTYYFIDGQFQPSQDGVTVYEIQL